MAVSDIQKLAFTECIKNFPPAKYAGGFFVRLYAAILVTRYILSEHPARSSS